MVSPELKTSHEKTYGHLNRIGAKLGDYVPIPTQHATNGTFAYRRELIGLTQYDPSACLAEEKKFLKEYTIPMVQLNPFKCILCMSHEHNTFDKRKLLALGGPSLRDRPDIQVTDFIRTPEEEPIRRFFLKEIDDLLKNYKAGEPSSKPDVLKQTIELEKKRDEQMANQMAGQQTVLTIQPPNGGEPVHLNLEQVVQILKNHEETIVRLQELNQQQKQYIEQQAQHIAELHRSQQAAVAAVAAAKKPSSIMNLLEKHVCKRDPEVTVNPIFDIAC